MEDAVQFARRNNVEPGALAAEQVQDGKGAVGLDGVADEVVQPGEGGVQAAEVVLDGPRAVDVEGRAVGGGEGGQVHPLATELALLVMEGVHGGNGGQAS